MLHKKIIHNNKPYAVFDIEYRNTHFPVILDYADFSIINNLNKTWKCNPNGFISCTHVTNNVTKETFLHDVVMALKIRDQVKDLNIDTNAKGRSILHINRIGLDNRRENLLYDTTNKPTNKNIKKKKRIICLPKESGINPDEIPTYIWYLKPNDSHGDRFIVEIGDVSWKTTSSSKVSLRYKLEEAKKFLRNLKEDSPHLFDKYSMNGEYTKDGKKLLHNFYNIIYKAEYTHIKKITTDNITDQYLKPEFGKLENKTEKFLLQTQNLVVVEDQRRRLF